MWLRHLRELKMNYFLRKASCEVHNEVFTYNSLIHTDYALWQTMMVKDMECCVTFLVGFLCQGALGMYKCTVSQALLSTETVIQAVILSNSLYLMPRPYVRVCCCLCQVLCSSPPTTPLPVTTTLLTSSATTLMWWRGWMDSLGTLLPHPAGEWMEHPSSSMGI